jgi:hypothetical protein
VTYVILLYEQDGWEISSPSVLKEIYGPFDSRALAEEINHEKLDGKGSVRKVSSSI